MKLVDHIIELLGVIGADFKALYTRVLPTGGNTGEALVKGSNADYAVTWVSIIAAVLAGYTSIAGTITAADTILSAIGKLNGNIALKADLLVSINARPSSYTLTASDNGKLVSISNANANNLTLPLNATVVIPIGFQVVYQQLGAGQTTFVPSTGVTINSADAKVKTRVSKSMATLIKTDTNVWSLGGDLA